MRTNSHHELNRIPDTEETRASENRDPVLFTWRPPQWTRAPSQVECSLFWMCQGPGPLLKNRFHSVWFHKNKSALGAELSDAISLWGCFPLLPFCSLWVLWLLEWAFSVLVYHRFELHPYQAFSLMAGLAPKGEVKTLYKSNPVPGSSREPCLHFWHNGFVFIQASCYVLHPGTYLVIQEFLSMWD